MPRYTATELNAMPTLCASQADDLKVDTGNKRVWLARVGVEDGAQYDDMVSVETLRDGRWVETDCYPG